MPSVRERVLARQVPDCVHTRCAQLPTYLLGSQMHVVLPKAHHLPEAQVQLGLQRPTHPNLWFYTSVLQLPPIQQHGCRRRDRLLSTFGEARQTP